jgi:hypothetical protein
MKKLLMLVTVTGLALSVHAQEFVKGTNIVSAGIGLGSSILSYSGAWAAILDTRDTATLVRRVHTATIKNGIIRLSASAAPTITMALMQTSWMYTEAPCFLTTT